VPDSSGTYGSSSAFTTSSTFDVSTGLPLTTTDANGLTTEITYDAATLRPRYSKFYKDYGVTGQTQVGPTNETIYHDESGNYWVKQKNQIDSVPNYAESTTYFDGLGRVVRTKKADAGGDVFTLTCYDSMGRTEKASNPFRGWTTEDCSTANGSSGVYWTSSTFDDAGRPWKITTPDGAYTETNYGLSTSGTIGTTVTVADPAGKLRRSITNASGQLTRVDEPNSSNALGSVSSPNQATSYTYDTLSNLTGVTQGSQTRSFTYSSLSRLRQATNPESGTIKYTYFAQTFANAQNVTSYGYDRYAYFSSRPNTRTGPNATGPLYLVAADGWANSTWGAIKNVTGYASVYPMVRKDPAKRR